MLYTINVQSPAENIAYTKVGQISKEMFRQIWKEIYLSYKIFQTWYKFKETTNKVFKEQISQNCKTL